MLSSRPAADSKPPRNSRILRVGNAMSHSPAPASSSASGGRIQSHGKESGIESDGERLGGDPICEVGKGITGETLTKFRDVGIRSGIRWAVGGGDGSASEQPDTGFFEQFPDRGRHPREHPWARTRHRGAGRIRLIDGINSTAGEHPGSAHEARLGRTPNHQNFETPGRVTNQTNGGSRSRSPAHGTMVQRFADRATNQRRIASRTDGISRRNPAASVRRPGVRRNAPAITIITPWASEAAGTTPCANSVRTV